MVDLGKEAGWDTMGMKKRGTYFTWSQDRGTFGLLAFETKQVAEL